MAKQLKISGNYFVLTDTVTFIDEVRILRSNVQFMRYGDGFVWSALTLLTTEQSQVRYDYTDLVDENAVAFASANAVEQWMADNTGKKLPLNREIVQVVLVATISTDVYTVPANTVFKNNSITVCNQSGAVRSFRMSVAIAGAVLTPAQYKYYNVSLPKDSSFLIEDGITLNETDVIRFYSSGTGVSVTINGQETA